jgi:hypothetical protein
MMKYDNDMRNRSLTDDFEGEAHEAEAYEETHHRYAESPEEEEEEIDPVLYNEAEAMNAVLKEVMAKLERGEELTPEMMAFIQQAMSKTSAHEAAAADPVPRRRRRAPPAGRAHQGSGMGLPPVQRRNSKPRRANSNAIARDKRDGRIARDNMHVASRLSNVQSSGLVGARKPKAARKLTSNKINRRKAATKISSANAKMASRLRNVRSSGLGATSGFIRPRKKVPKKKKKPKKKPSYEYTLAGYELRDSRQPSWDSTR